MRALSVVLVAIALSVSSAGSAHAGKSRSAHEGGGSFAVSGATRTFGSGQFGFSHHRHGSGVTFHHRKRLRFRSDSSFGTIVPALRGTIVPPFQIGRPFGRDRFFTHPTGGFVLGGGGVGQTIIIVQPVPVPVANPSSATRRVTPQIVEIARPTAKAEVQVFTPSAGE